jgi:hypothetical protein
MFHALVGIVRFSRSSRITFCCGSGFLDSAIS